MKIASTGLIIENFGSFLGRHALDLEAFGPGLHFIRGDNRAEPRLTTNGCGKSMIWDALCWCRYGQTPDGRRNPDIAPRFGDRHTTVIERLRIDGAERSIKRTTNPNRLSLDDKEVGQEQIDQLVGTINTFTHTQLLGQAEPLFFDLKPEAKMSLFGTVLDLDRWDERSDLASKETKALQVEETSTRNSIVVLETEKQRTDSQYARVSEQWSSWKASQAERVDANKTELRRLQTEAKQTDGKRAEYDLAYNSAETELRAIRSSLDRIGPERDRVQIALTRAEGKVSQINEQLTKARTLLREFGTADDCPTCGRPLKGTQIGKHKSELESLINKTETALKDAKIAKTKADSDFDHVRERNTKLRRDETEFQRKSSAARDSLNVIAPTLARIEAKVQQLKQQIADADQERNPYTEQVNDLRRAAKELDGKLATKAKDLERVQKDIEHTKFWIQGFKDIRLLLIEEVLQELELTTNANLADVGLVDWEVTYDIERETKAGTVQRKLNVMIRSPKDQDPVKWECWSGGEGQRLRVEGALALSEVLLARAGMEISMEVLDEPITFLSQAGVNDLCDYLADRAKQLNRQIWFVDHMSTESARFTSVLTVIKDGNGSKFG